MTEKTYRTVDDLTPTDYGKLRRKMQSATRRAKKSIAEIRDVLTPRQDEMDQPMDF
jgi:hypothetical protein